jgi:hypothetical protein
MAKRKYSTQSDLATYHVIKMNGKKLSGVQRIKVATGLDDDLRTIVTLEFVIKAGSLKADGEVIEFDML